MKERGILFSAPMVRALLDGSKTQTRRVVKAIHLSWFESSVTNFLDGKWNQRPLPYGRPGDRLWVREAWRTVTANDTCPPRSLLPAATRLWYEADTPHQPGFGRLRPGMFMPRWASRLTLEVTGIRVERLQDISALDALSEGIKINIDAATKQPLTRISGKFPPAQYIKGNGLVIAEYASLWATINGAGSWASNPPVWVVEFKVIK
jgi:hypothetical protein